MAQMQREANETFLSEKQQKSREFCTDQSKILREQAAQTTSVNLVTSPNGKADDFVIGTTLSGGFEPEQARLSHVLSLAGQIQSPIQAIAALIDNAVEQFHSQIVHKLSVTRGPPLRCDISLLGLESQNFNALHMNQNLVLPKEETKLLQQPDQNEFPQNTNIRATRQKLCLRITDNGTGISPYRMRNFLTQFGNEPPKVSQSGPFDIAEHGIGLKLAILRLGQTGLILSKTSPSGQIGVQNFSVALISTAFCHKERTPFLVAPLLSFVIRNKQSFHELTGHGDRMFAEINKHASSIGIFDSQESLMSYALNKMGLHGTHIYVTDLAKSPNCEDQPELDIIKDDIQVRQRPQTTENLVEMVIGNPLLIENSLRQYLKFMYLCHPQFLQLSINGKLFEQPIQNAFNKLLQVQMKGSGADSWFAQVKTKEFAAQILTPQVRYNDTQRQNQQLERVKTLPTSFQQQLKSSGQLETMMNEKGIKIEELGQGVLLYRGNRLVRRLQGRFGELREQAHTIADLMREELSSVEDTSEVHLGKRTFSERNGTSQRDCLMSLLFKQSGVVSIFPHASQSTIDKTDVQDKSVINAVRDAITNTIESK